MTRPIAALVVAVWFLGLTSTASAQQAEAREHFQRGVQLYDEGRFDGALAEFDEAYRVAPSYQVLFNLAQVHARLGHAVRAVDAYERYLAEGGDRIAAARRASVEQELEVHRARIGSLAIEAGVAGATISIDGSVVAQTPLGAPLRVTVGDHLVEVSATGYQPQQRRVAVAGGVVVPVQFSLIESGAARGTVRIECPLRDVEISIDGEVVGRTPLEGSLSVQPGLREVRAARAGYLPYVHTVDVGIGAEADLTIALEVDTSATRALGQLSVAAPPEASVFVDGELTDPSRAQTLPIGDHEVRIELADAVPSSQRVQIEAESLMEVRPSLRYTPAARAARVAGVSGTRTIAAAFTVVGAVLLAGGAGVTIWSEIRREELDFDARRALHQRCEMMVGDPPDECFGPVIPEGTPRTGYPEAVESAFRQFNADVAEFNALSAVGYTLIAVGAVGLAISVIVLATTPSDEEAATIQVGVGPGGLRVGGVF